MHASERAILWLQKGDYHIDAWCNTEKLIGAKTATTHTHTHTNQPKSTWVLPRFSISIHRVIWLDGVIKTDRKNIVQVHAHSPVVRSLRVLVEAANSCCMYVACSLCSFVKRPRPTATTSNEKWKKKNLTENKQLETQKHIRVEPFSICNWAKHTYIFDKFNFDFTVKSHSLRTVGCFVLCAFFIFLPLFARLSDAESK